MRAWIRAAPPLPCRSRGAPSCRRSRSVRPPSPGLRASSAACSAAARSPRRASWATTSSRRSRRSATASCRRIATRRRRTSAPRATSRRCSPPSTATRRSSTPAAPSAGAVRTPTARGRRSGAFPQNAFATADRADAPAGALLARRALRLRGRGPARRTLARSGAARSSGLRDVYRAGARGRRRRRAGARRAPFPALATASRTTVARRARRARRLLDVPGARRELPRRRDPPRARGLLLGARVRRQPRAARGWRMIGIEGDAQPLGYSIFSRRERRATASAPTTRCRPRTPTSSRGGASLPASALRRRRRRSRDTIADFAALARAARAGRAAARPWPASARRPTPRQPRPRRSSTSCVIGSGAGGGSAAHVLAAGRQERPRARGRPQPVPGPRPARRDPAAATTRTTSSSTPCAASSARRGCSSRAPSAPARTPRPRASTSDVNALPQARRRRLPARRLQDAALQRRRLPTAEPRSRR